MNELKNEFLEELLNKAAWKKISEESCWTKETLEKYQDKVDWKSISGNCEVKWTSSMLEMFKNRIDWTELSSCASKKLITATNLEKFKDYWNWSELSGNTNFNLTEEIIDKYIDLWDWQRIIERYVYDNEDLLTIAFFEKYADRIPMFDFLNSNLWRSMIDQRKSELESELD